MTDSELEREAREYVRRAGLGGNVRESNIAILAFHAGAQTFAAPAAPSPIGSVDEAVSRLRAWVPQGETPLSDDAHALLGLADALIEAVRNEKSADDLNGPSEA